MGQFVPTNPDKAVRLSDISAAKYAEILFHWNILPAPMREIIEH